MDAVKRLDDGKTDPVSIAYGIAPQCAVEYNRFSQEFFAHFTTEISQAWARQTMKENEVKLITGAVVIWRSKQQKR